MATLQDIAKEFGLETQLARLTTDSLDWHCRHGLVVLRVSSNGNPHFVLCEKIDGENVQVCDARRRFVMPTTALESKWDGESLILSTESITQPRRASRMRWPMATAAVLLLLATSFYFVRRKRALASIWILAIVCVCGCQKHVSTKRQQASTSSKEETAAGIVVVGSSVIDLGVVEPDQEPKIAKFTLRNASHAEVSIDDVRTSCSCAFATASAQTIAPDETCDIQIHLDPLKAVSGSASVTVVTGAGDLHLRTTWKLGGAIQTTAKEFPILDVPVGGVNQSVIRLNGDGVGSAQAESVTEKQTPGIEHRAVIADGACTLEAKVGEAVDPGLYYGCVEISSTANTNIRILVPWTLRVTAPLAIAPDKLYFLTNAETNLAGAQIVVDFSKLYKLADLRIEAVPANLSSFSVDIEATGDQGCVVNISVSQEDRARLSGLSFRLGSEYSRVLKVHE